LNLWVVRNGEIVEGIDLHPFLRTADTRYDQALQNVIDESSEEFREFFDLVSEAYPFVTAAALPLLDRGLELCERAAEGEDDALGELEDISNELEEAIAAQRPPALPYGTISNHLRLDWDAITTAAPPCRPTSNMGRFRVRWTEAHPRHRESCIHDGVTLHFGVNDFEIGDDEYIEDGYGRRPERDSAAM
jgi:hypothetical protein